MPLEMRLFIVKQNVLEAQKRSRATSDKGVGHLAICYYLSWLERMDFGQRQWNFFSEYNEWKKE